MTKQLVQAPADPKGKGKRIHASGATVHLRPHEKRFLPEHLARAAGAVGCYVLPPEMADADTKGGDGGEPTPDADEGGNKTPETGEAEVSLAGGDGGDGGDGSANPSGENEVRHGQIVEAIKRIVERGDSREFTDGGSGRPRKSAVTAEVGYDVELEEIEPAYTEVLNGHST